MRIFNEEDCGMCLLKDLQDKVKEIQSSGMIDKVLQEGAEKASYYARKKVAKVYRKVGLR